MLGSGGPGGKVFVLCPVRDPSRQLVCLFSSSLFFLFCSGLIKKVMDSDGPIVDVVILHEDGTMEQRVCVFLSITLSLLSLTMTRRS
jgi:hypothetical protein